MTPTLIKWILTFSIRECIILSVLSEIARHFSKYPVISSTNFCTSGESLLVSSAFCWVFSPLKKVEWQDIVISLIQWPNRTVLQRFLANSGHLWSTPTTSSWIKLDKIATTSFTLSSRWSTSGVLALAFSRNCFIDCKLFWQVSEKSAIVSKLHDLLRDHKAS